MPHSQEFHMYTYLLGKNPLLMLLTSEGETKKNFHDDYSGHDVWVTDLLIPVYGIS